MMHISPTKFLSFLEGVPTLSIERNQFSSPAFNRLRSGMRRTIAQLRESDDTYAEDIANRARKILFEWLASPIRFDEKFLNNIKELGTPEDFVSNWGILELGPCLQAAEFLVGNSNEYQNPLRAEVGKKLKILRQKGVKFRIFCRQDLRQEFDLLVSDLGDEPLCDDHFIFTLAQYRRSELFDYLLKVGPLRSFGMSAVPDSILSAHKYRRLLQFVWAGCDDEEDIGMDPSGSNGSTLECQSQEPLLELIVHESGYGPKSENFQLNLRNEFEDFPEAVCRGNKLKARLVRIADGDGVLIPAHSSVLSFDSGVDGIDAIAFREPLSELSVGMYLILPRIGEVDYGGVKPSDELARVWKTRLVQYLQKEPGALCKQLGKNGINLKTLESRVKCWARDADASGIHAPLYRRHFWKLIQVLELEGPLGRDQDWWLAAWSEIQTSRGLAQREGKEEMQILNQNQLEALRCMLPAIRENRGMDQFSLPTPPTQELKGRFMFYRVLEVGAGYLIPSEMLWQFFNTDELEEWRLA